MEGCNLCNELKKEDNILYKTNNFFVIPTIGPMEIEGYVLLCSKEHYFGVGDIPKKNISELEFILKKTKNVILNTYNSKVLVFEHGPRYGCYKAGSCLDHSHLHIIPTSIEVIETLKEKKLKLEEIQDLSRLKEIYKGKKSSYLFIETQDNKRYIIEPKLPIPSQFLRQIIATKKGIKEWDWRINPGYETFKKTYNKLKEEFKLY